MKMNDNVEEVEEYNYSVTVPINALYIT